MNDLNSPPAIRPLETSHIRLFFGLFLGASLVWTKLAQEAHTVAAMARALALGALAFQVAANTMTTIRNAGHDIFAAQRGCSSL